MLNLQSHLGEINTLRILTELGISLHSFKSLIIFYQCFIVFCIEIIDFAHILLNLYLSISCFLVKVDFLKCKLDHVVSPV